MSKILIIEDEVAIADLEKDYLELSGFEVAIENAGDTGLKKALEEDFDLIVLDLMLPGMDGFETTHRIRSGECGIEKAAIPIIGFTARTVNEIYDQVFQIGMNEVLSKPLHPNMLVDNLKKFCSKK